MPGLWGQQASPSSGPPASLLHRPWPYQGSFRRPAFSSTCAWAPASHFQKDSAQLGHTVPSQRSSQVLRGQQAPPLLRAVVNDVCLRQAAHDSFRHHERQRSCPTKHSLCGLKTLERKSVWRLTTGHETSRTTLDPWDMWKGPCHLRSHHSK